MQNIDNLISQVIFVYSDWILIKKIIFSPISFRCWGKQIFEIILSEGMSNFLLPRVWWQELEDDFCVERDISQNVLIQYIVSFSPVGGNRFLKNCCLREWAISFCLVCADKKLGGEFWVRRDMKKNALIRYIF